MPTFLLTADELVELTGNRRSDAQARVLTALGIPYVARPNGTLAVLRSVVERALGGGECVAPPDKPEPELHL